MHDYQLTLVPGLIKRERPDITVVFFWHIPWPHYDVFRVCPQNKMILASLGMCDMIGFHIPGYSRNFEDCYHRVVGQPERTVNIDSITREFPISIDFDDIDLRARSRETLKGMQKLSKRYKLDGKILSCGVDRMDYTKGIPERLEAIGILLDKYPQYRGKFTHFQVCSPSRVEITEYKMIKKKVHDLTRSINDKYATEDWKPLLVFHKNFSFEQLLPLYRLADMAILSPLVDGMNLVAQEYLAAQVEEKGILLLSEFAGAARRVTNAIIFNPFERDSFAERIHEALEMPTDEKRLQMKLARKSVKEYNIYDWVNHFLTDSFDIAAHRRARREVGTDA